MRRSSLWSRSLLTAVLAFGAVGAQLVVTPAVAVAQGAQVGSATDFVKAKHQTLTRLIREKAPPAKIDAELKTLLDYQEMARAALGVHWDSHTEAERKEYTDLLRQSIEKSYKKRLNDTLTYDVSYKAEEPKGTDTVVRTAARNTSDKREAPSQIDYVLRRKGGNFVVVDVVTEGSSTVVTWRKETEKSIKKNGWDGLIKKMKENLAKP